MLVWSFVLSLHSFAESVHSPLWLELLLLDDNNFTSALTSLPNASTLWACLLDAYSLCGAGMNQLNFLLLRHLFLLVSAEGIALFPPWTVSSFGLSVHFCLALGSSDIFSLAF